jgi:PAS domain S-box-containing protein
MSENTSRGRGYIVEDEYIIGQNLKYKLIENGFEVINVVTTGEVALDDFELCSDCVDFILMDIMLDGEMDGIETALELKNKYDIPVIFLTAYSGDSFLERSKLAEPYSYILKPFSDRELLINIEIAIYKHRIEKELKIAQKKLQILNATLKEKVSEQTKEILNKNRELEKLSKVVEQSHENVIIANEEGVVEYVNPAFLKLYNYNSNEVLGMDLVSIKTGLKSFDIKTFLTSESKENIFENEIINITKQNQIIHEEISIYPLRNENGEIKKIVVVGKDISLRKSLQKENAEHIKILESIFKAVPAVIFVYSLKNNKTLIVNEYVNDLIGFDASEVLDWNVNDLLENTGLNLDLKNLEDKISEHFTNESIFEGQTKIKNKDHKTVWINYVVVPYEIDASGTLLKVLGIVTDITKQRNREKQFNAMMRLHEIMKKKEQKLRTLSLLQGQEQEKRRLSIEIHDNIGQLLTAIKLHVENNLSPNNQLSSEVEYQDSLEKVKLLIKQTIFEVRKISKEIAPAELHDFGLYPALKNMIDRISGTNLHIDFRCNNKTKRFNPIFEQEIYRIAQEAINNSLKHSKSKNLIVSIDFGNEYLELKVEDTGVGFVSNEVVYGNKGIGVISMKERAAAIGGKLEIISELSKGCTINFLINNKLI